MAEREPYYPSLSPVSTGLAGKCPRCGRGRLFSGYLKVADRCGSCKLDFGFADAGDGAAWFIMLIVGFVAVAVVLWIELTWQPAYWVHMVVAVPLVFGLSLILLRPAKGLLICQQYATKAQEGRRQSS